MLVPAKPLQMYICNPMPIDTDILLTYGASTRKLKKGDVVFAEGGEARYFYQVLEGVVKVITTNEDGKELIQGFFKPGESFGEPPLFVNHPYPSTALAYEDAVVLRLPRESFFRMLHEYPGIAFSMLEIFACRIYNKAVNSQIRNTPSPEHKLLALLDKLKSEQDHFTDRMHVKYTRQQLADFTGLRVETVIRTLTKLSKKQVVEIVDHKLYY